MGHAGHAFLALILWASLTAPPATAQAGDPAQAAAPLPAVETLTILSVDATTLPGMAKIAGRDLAPAWRTSFGSERRTEPKRTGPDTAVDADIVLLQGVRDVRTLRLWFPARSWKLIVSRQMLMSDDPLDSWARDGIAPVPTTAVGVRYRPGLRVTAQDHLLDIADLAKAEDGTPGAAATAVRVLIAGRETWAISVLLPPDCIKAVNPDCPARQRLMDWHAAREGEGVRRVTGGRFARPAEPAGADQENCHQYGLRLDPAPPPPRQQLTLAEAGTPLGCAAAVSVAK